MALDKKGNVFVTGQTGGDFTTIKYAPNGDTLWVRKYNGTGNGEDVAYALAVDDSGNACVTGYSVGNGTAADYTTIKYSPQGDTKWVRRYNGLANDEDKAISIVVDKAGNVYVTGHSIGNGTSYDYLTIKYGPTGDTHWVKRYDAATFRDEAHGLAVDMSGNVYVTGNSIANFSSLHDCATIKYTSTGDTLWVRHYDYEGVGGNDVGRSLVVDTNGNVYVSGIGSRHGYPFDYLTIKYSSDGDTLWSRSYNGSRNGYDEVSALSSDEEGNIYITGYISSINSLKDFFTIKYSSLGDILWMRDYNGIGNRDDEAIDLTIDKSGYVYVTGWSLSETSMDYVIIKYIQFECISMPGDANGDNQILLSDIIAIVNFLFEDEPLPEPLCRADANANGIVTFQDIIYLVNSVFKGGLAPIKSRECCL